MSDFMLGSVGFKAFLETTDRRRPLSDYITVLEGTALILEKHERERAWLIELAAGITDIIHAGNTERCDEAWKAMSGELWLEIEAKETKRD